MNDFYQVTDAERGEVIIKAMEWARKFPDVVKRRVNMADGSYSPKGSDLFHPELWKSSHWRWFYNYLKATGVKK